METEEEDEENEEEYSDDDDMSWKVRYDFIIANKEPPILIYSFQVRRCAAKCLEAIISTHTDLLIDFYRTISPVLIGRFKGVQHSFFLNNA